MWATPEARNSPRCKLDAFCTVVTDQHVKYANVLDLSENGMLIERPTFIREDVFGLELELPELDDLLWFKARHSNFRPVVGVDRSLNLQRGLEIVGGAPKHLKVIREYVLDQKRLHQHRDHWMSRLMMSSRSRWA